MNLSSNPVYVTQMWSSYIKFILLSAKFFSENQFGNILIISQSEYIIIVIKSKII